MELTGQQLIPASQQATWQALNDPDMLRQCIAGCESVELTGENQYLAKMAVRIGPVNAKFTGKLQLQDIDEPNAYTINFDGQGGVAGFGKGSARVTLSPQEGATLLSYNANAQVGGKLAQIGSRLIDGAARKIADDFFKEFNQRVAALNAPVQASSEASQTIDGAGTQPALTSPPPLPAPVPPSSGRNWLWPAVALIVGLVIGWMAK
jgi:uncharacterized protein